MQQTLERRLLYYHGSVEMPVNWYGEPIYKSIYSDVKNGEQIILSSCSLSQDISKVFGEHYYSTITDAEKDFDILWHVVDDVVNPIDEHFLHVQGVYERMLRDGVEMCDINDRMIDFFGSLKVKCSCF